MTEPIDILALSPHPDDAEIGCGGLLLLAVRQGLRTAIVDLTEGERASRGTPDLRRQEKVLAAERLGVATRQGLGLPDTQLGRDPAHEAALVACLRRLRPRLLLAPVAEDRHPDHAEAARLAQRAAFLAGVAKVGDGTPHRVERLLSYAIHQPVTPSLVVDVGSVWQERQQVLAAYASQFAADGAPPTSLGDGSFLQALEARARHYGAMINALYGEPYVAAGPLAVYAAGDLLSPADRPASYGSYR